MNPSSSSDIMLFLNYFSNYFPKFQNTQNQLDGIEITSGVDDGTDYKVVINYTNKDYIVESILISVMKSQIIIELRKSVETLNLDNLYISIMIIKEMKSKIIAAVQQGKKEFQKLQNKDLTLNFEPQIIVGVLKIDEDDDELTRSKIEWFNSYAETVKEHISNSLKTENREFKLKPSGELRMY
jgi:hypothetical protein